jgi:ribose/xylose/arabinose/galactoside ABC-type transport system permease subunit/ABC-type sugar transport system substrate-binding protein
MSDNQKQLLLKLTALGGLLLLIIIFSVTSGSFLTMNNIMTVGLQTSTIAFIGMGATCVILTGGIDLSIGSVVALSGVAAGLSIKAGLPVELGMLVGIAAGALSGAVNGLLVTNFRLPPFIATLGTMMIARGLALYVTNAAPVSGLPDSFGALGNGSLWRMTSIGENGLPSVVFPGIPYPVVIMVALALVFTFVLVKMRFGRYLYAIGSNEEAARLSGIKTDRVKLYAYTLCGAMSGLCGIIIASRLVTAQPNGGVMYELDAIASAVVGGTSLMGGVGSIPGTLIGAFIIGVLRNGLNMNGISFFVQQIIIGGVILLAVAYDQVRQHKKTKKPLKKTKPSLKENNVMNKIAMVAMIGLTTVFAVPHAFAKQSEIAVIVKTANSNYWQNVSKGASDAEKSLKGKYKITFQGPDSETAVADQVNMVDNAINRGVAGIVLAPSDPDALIPEIKKAWENGIPVVLIDSALNKKGEQYYQSFLSTDNRKAGAIAADKLIAKNGKEGKVSVMSFTPGAGSAIERVGGFTDEIAKNSHVKIVGPYYSQSDMATALNQTIDAMASNKDITALFGANEPTATGMARAIKQLGYAGKVVAIGFDGNTLLQDFVRDGTLDGILVQSSYQMGFKGVTTVDAIINKQKVEKFIDTGVIYVTKANIDSPEAKAVLY